MKKRIIISLPDALKRVIEKAAKHRGCSQAEIIRTALYTHLKDFLSKDNPKRENDN
jgi:metal-responsive CopG/Arc/MetJ family transcriptional regulator